MFFALIPLKQKLFGMEDFNTRKYRKIIMLIKYTWCQNEGKKSLCMFRAQGAGSWGQGAGFVRYIDVMKSYYGFNGMLLLLGKWLATHYERMETLYYNSNSVFIFVISFGCLVADLSFSTKKKLHGKCNL